MTYRPAEEKDTESVYNVVKSAIAKMEADRIFQWDEIYPTREDIAEDIRKNSLSIGMLGSDIAVIYTINDECDEQYKYGAWKYPNCKYRILHRLCVYSKFQNRGIANRTLKHIENDLRAKGIEALRLDVFSKNPYALSLYHNNGYENVGIAEWRKGTFLLMEKHL